MGLFYTRRGDLAPLIRPELHDALIAEPLNTALAIDKADKTTKRILADAFPKLAWGRVLCALGLVVGLLVLYLVAVHDDKMSSHADQVWQLFVTAASGLTGLVVGEGASKG
jgi:hypothetical protein